MITQETLVTDITDIINFESGYVTTIWARYGDEREIIQDMIDKFALYNKNSSIIDIYNCEYINPNDIKELLLESDYDSDKFVKAFALKDTFCKSLLQLTGLDHFKLNLARLTFTETDLVFLLQPFCCEQFKDIFSDGLSCFLPETAFVIFDKSELADVFANEVWEIEAVSETLSAPLQLAA